MKELEIVQYKHVQGLSVFINILKYRNPHFHNMWELIWVLEGKLEVSIDNREEIVKRGQLFLIPPSKVHELHTENFSCAFMCIQMSIEFVHLSERIVTENYLISDLLSKEEILEIKKSALSLGKMYFSNDALASLACAWECNGIMFRILNSIPYKNLSSDQAELRQKRDKRLEEMFEFVEKNYMHKIRLSDFAKEQNLSMSYLSHFFKDSMNQTFQDYVSSVRIQVASRLIATKSLRLTAASDLAGFSDYKYFVRDFRKHFGVSPEEYARQKLSDGEIRKNRLVGSGSEERLLSDSESLEVLNSIILEQ